MTLADLIAAHVAQHGYMPGSPYLQKAGGVSDHAARKALSAYVEAHPETPPHPSTPPSKRHVGRVGPAPTSAHPAAFIFAPPESSPPAPRVEWQKPPEAASPPVIPRMEWQENPEAQTATLEIPKSSVRTLEELLAVAQVDTEVWAVERFVVNQWNSSMRGSDGEPVVTPLWQVKAWLKRRPGVDDLRRLRADTLAAIETHAPTYAPITRPPNNGGHLLMLSPSDAHLGKLAWAGETGSTYNLSVAVRTVRDALRSLTADALPLGLERICLVVGNDLMQADSPRGQTYRGTQVDMSARYWEVFGAARDLMVGEVEWLTQFAPVDVVVCTGNHDATAALHLGEVLAAWFRNHPEVTVDASPTARKYLRHGSCLLGFVHGDEEKHAALPQIMAQERPHDWAQTTCREWITGHYHRKAEKHYAPLLQDGGVIVRTIPALSGRDEWSTRRGYLTPAAAQAIVYARTGLKAQFHHHVGGTV